MIRKIPFLLLLAAVWVTAAPATDLVGGDPSPQARSERPARVVSHRIGLTVEPASRVVDCSDTMLVRYANSGVDSAFLRMNPAFAIGSLLVNGRETPYVLESGTLRWPRRGDDPIAVVTLRYRGRVDFPSQFTRVTTERAVIRAEELLPWGEGMIDSGRLAVTVPLDWEVFAPGTRIEGAGVAGTAGGTRTRSFGWDVPVGTVGWICAGVYRPVVRSAGGGMTAVYRLPRGPGDAPPDTLSDGAIAALGDSLLSYYGAAFLPYRFARLDIVEIDDWVAGGTVLAIAAPSFVMVKRLAFETDDPFNRAGTILPHEVAHQWWMGAVHPVPKAHALLSEGLCEYSSILYSEAAGGRRSRDTLAASPFLRALISKVRRGAAVPLDTALDIRLVLTQYLKGAYVHHMLRGEIGDGPFRAALRRFARTFAGREAGISDFRAAAEGESGRDLGWFFKQWVEGSGLPALKAYNVKAARDGGGWLVSGRLRIAGYARYTLGVVLRVEAEGGESGTTVRLGLDSAGDYRNDVPFSIRCSGTPTTVTVDPDGDLLMMRKLPPKLSDLRDAGDALMVVGGGERAPLYRLLASGDSARLARWGWEVRTIPDSEATLGDLQRERVILYGTTSDNRVAADLAGALPFVASADSAVVAGETVRDPSLGLFQAGVNPWLAEGVIVWIQPLGDDARPELRPWDDSWTVVRGGERIHGGTWEVEDPSLVVPVRRQP